MRRQPRHGLGGAQDPQRPCRFHPHRGVAVGQEPEERRPGVPVADFAQHHGGAGAHARLRVAHRSGQHRARVRERNALERPHRLDADGVVLVPEEVADGLHRLLLAQARQRAQELGRDGWSLLLLQPLDERVRHRRVPHLAQNLGDGVADARIRLRERLDEDLHHAGLAGHDQLLARRDVAVAGPLEEPVQHAQALQRHRGAAPHLGVGIIERLEQRVDGAVAQLLQRLDDADPNPPLAVLQRVDQVVERARIADGAQRAHRLDAHVRHRVAEHQVQDLRHRAPVADLAERRGRPRAHLVLQVGQAGEERRHPLGALELAQDLRCPRARTGVGALADQLHQRLAGRLAELQDDLGHPRR